MGEVRASLSVAVGIPAPHGIYVRLKECGTPQMRRPEIPTRTLPRNHLELSVERLAGARICALWASPETRRPSRLAVRAAGGGVAAGSKRYSAQPAVEDVYNKLQSARGEPEER